MLYLFWSPTKTIDYFICLWLINIKLVKGVCFDLFVLRVFVFIQHSLPFLANSQLVTNIY